MRQVRAAARPVYPRNCFGRRHQPRRDPCLDAGDPGPFGDHLTGPLRLLPLLHNSSLTGPFGVAGTVFRCHGIKSLRRAARAKRRATDGQSSISSRSLWLSSLSISAIWS